LSTKGLNISGLISAHLQLVVLSAAQLYANCPSWSSWSHAVAEINQENFMQKRDVNRTIEQMVTSINAARQMAEPFYHLQFSDLLPANLYSEMLEQMPVREDYRLMSGRTKSTRTNDGDGTRIKLDLFPEFIRHLPQAKREIWSHLGKAIRSPKVRDAFIQRLAPGLERRFGPTYSKIGMYPIPILTRDRPGYKIGIHPDTHWKGMTIQIYLPPDDSIRHVGTVFHRRTGEKTYERASQMAFLPNSGYAFAVDKDTYHSVDTVGPEVKVRDSILLTYFVDSFPLHFFRNRGRRVGNFALNELRSLRRPQTFPDSQPEPAMTR
jgi:hypothetical protein